MKNTVVIKESEFEALVTESVRGVLNRLGGAMHSAMGEESNSQSLKKYSNYVKQIAPGYGVVLKSPTNMAKDPNCLKTDFTWKYIKNRLAEDPGFKMACLYKKGEQRYTPLRTWCLYTDRGDYTLKYNKLMLADVEEDVRAAIDRLDSFDDLNITEGVLENSEGAVDKVLNYLENQDWFIDFNRERARQNGGEELRDWLLKLGQTNELINVISHAFEWFGSLKGRKFWSKVHDEYMKWYKEEFGEGKPFYYKGDDYSSF